VTADQTFGTGITDDGGVAVTLPDQTIVDGVGLSIGPAFKEGTPLASLGGANVDHSYERKPGGSLGSGQDTDDNAADFTLIAPSDPQNSSPLSCIGSTTPTSPSGAGSATPANVETGSTSLLTVKVTPGTNPTSTGIAVTGDLSSIGESATQSFFDDGSHGDATAGDNTFSYLATVAAGTSTGGKSLPETITDAQSRTGSATIALTVSEPSPITHIATIQGAAQVSPINGQNVTNVRGIVTGLRSNGFYMQDPEPDSDPATSEGVFAFTSSAPSVAVGDLVRVDGRVSEFIPGGTSTGNLPTTEVSTSNARVSVLSNGNALPAPVVASPPTSIVEDDSAPDVRNGNVFDPAQDGLDYWESLEGMRVEVDNPVAVGPQNSFGELPVASDGPAIGPRTIRGGLLLTPTDSNPERIILDDAILPTPPNVNVGDHFDGPAIGVLDYNFGNFMLELTQPLARVDGGLQREITAAAAANELSIATFNVENLDIGDGAAKFDGLADRIVHNLRSPKIVALEEVQDNNGPTDDGTVDADVTLNRLVAAIQAAGGPAYSYTYISPVNDADGGEPGGNIRIAFLYDTAAGVSLPAGATKGGSTDANSVVTDASGAPHLALDPGRIDPLNAAWSSSRKPLAGEFVFRGQTFFVIGNHFNSKGGDDPLLGRFQPPTRSSEVQRHQQAQLVHDFVASILAHDAQAKVVVLGDLNDFQFSDTVHILEGGATPILADMIDTLPANEQYSYEFEGNAQVLDHILATTGVKSPSFDVVHINAEFWDQLSDHDPSVLRVLVNDAPSASAGGPYTVDEGSSVSLTATASDANGDALTYSWDFGNDGTQDATGSTVSYAAGDGPADVPVSLTVSDGTTSTKVTTTIHVANVPPTATFVAPASVLAGSSIELALTGATDASAADRASLQFAFDCGTGFGAFSSVSTASCSTDSAGARDVRGAVRDKDGGQTIYTATVQVQVTVDSLCALVTEWSKNAGQANSLCVKLATGQLEAFAREVDAQSGKAFTEEQAATLKRLASQLQ
jgi:predicted extracellular nuclease